VLKFPTPFPQQGSYAVYASDGEDQLARIISRPNGAEALISLPLHVGSSGNLNVPIEALRDGTPVTEAERVELQSLNHKRLKVGSAEAKRKAELTARIETAPILARLLDTLKRRERAQARREPVGAFA
jgi:hypothetical protein